MDEAEVNAVLSAAENDHASADRRIELCRALGEAFRETGDLLWVKGKLLGADRVSKASPFDFGDDAAVGLATVIQIAGELTTGAVALMERDNLYAAAALIRQLVEIEYLAWAFAEDQEQAKGWLRSTREEQTAVLAAPRSPAALTRPVPISRLRNTLRTRRPPDTRGIGTAT